MGTHGKSLVSIKFSEWKLFMNLESLHSQNFVMGNRDYLSKDSAIKLGAKSCQIIEPSRSPDATMVSPLSLLFVSAFPPIYVGSRLGRIRPIRQNQITKFTFLNSRNISWKLVQDLVIVEERI
jgi:hypothetical protein